MVKKISLMLVIATMLLMLMPGLCYAAEKETFTDQERLKEEAAENYDAAKEQMNEIYFDAIDRMTDDGGPLSGEPIDEWAYRSFYRIYKLISDNCVFIILFSELLGVAILILARKNKVFQRFALVALMIVIPFFVLLFVYGVGASPLFKRM